MVSLTGLVSAIVLAATTVNALDKPLYGMNYDLRQGPDWDGNKCKSAGTIANELKILSSITKNVRTYSLGDCTVRPVLTTAKSLGMTVWLGVWVSADKSVFEKEVAKLQLLIKEGLIDSNVIGFNVGSEAVYRKDITSEDAVAYVVEFKKVLADAGINVPVSVTDISDILLQFPEMIEVSDVVTVNLFPFWEKYQPSKGAARFNSRIQPLIGAAGGKPVIITETGWSTGGKNENSSIASPEGAARYLNDFYLLASQNNWKYYYFQAFDSPWKAQLPGETDTVESHFGIFGGDGKMKKEYAALKFGAMSGGDSATSEESSKKSSASGSKTGSNEEGTASSTTAESATDDESGPGMVNPASSTTGTSDVDKPSATKKATTAPSSSATMLASGLSALVAVVSAVALSM